jgi:hypothetical protein
MALVREGGRAGERADAQGSCPLSHSLPREGRPGRIRPGRRTTRRPRFPLTVSPPPCVPSRADPSGLGHAATIYSSVQGRPGVETPTTANTSSGLAHCHTRALMEQSRVHLIYAPEKTTHIITECIEINVINVLIT